MTDFVKQLVCMGVTGPTESKSGRNLAYSLTVILAIFVKKNSQYELKLSSKYSSSTPNIYQF